MYLVCIKVYNKWLPDALVESSFVHTAEFNSGNIWITKILMSKKEFLPPSPKNYFLPRAVVFSGWLYRHSLI